jgi:hypothetical protein
MTADELEDLARQMSDMRKKLDSTPVSAFRDEAMLSALDDVRHEAMALYDAADAIVDGEESS